MMAAKSEGRQVTSGTGMETAWAGRAASVHTPTPSSPPKLHRQLRLLPSSQTPHPPTPSATGALPAASAWIEPSPAIMLTAFIARPVVEFRQRDKSKIDSILAYGMPIRPRRCIR